MQALLDDYRSVEVFVFVYPGRNTPEGVELAASFLILGDTWRRQQWICNVAYTVQ